MANLEKTKSEKIASLTNEIKEQEIKVASLEKQIEIKQGQRRRTLIDARRTRLWVEMVGIQSEIDMCYSKIASLQKELTTNHSDEEL